MTAIQGIGAILNIGSSKEEVFANLLRYNEIKTDFFQPLSFESLAPNDPIIKSALIRYSDDELRKLLGNKLAVKIPKDVSRTELLAGIAISEALEDTKLNVPLSRIGIFCGTSQACTPKLEEFYRSYHFSKVPRISLLKNGGYAIVNNYIAKLFGIRGPRYTISTACSSSLTISRLMLQFLRNNEIDAAILYGVDASSELVNSGFFSLGALAKDVTRPFSIGGDGISVGEGAVAMVVTNESSAKYGYIVDVALTSDAWHITSPDPKGRGAYRAMNSASCAINQEEFGLICAHGTGTNSNDKCESHAIQTFTEGKIPPSVISLKGAIGHTIGAAGVANLALASMLLSQQQVPKNPGLISLREGLAINVSTNAQSKKFDYALVNAFGFGGNNASACISRVDNKSYLPFSMPGIVEDSSTLVTQQSSTREGFSKKSDVIYITGIGTSYSGGISFEKLKADILANKTPLLTETETLSFSGRKKSSGAYIIKSELLAEIDRSLIMRQNFARMDRISKLTTFVTLEILKSAKLRLNSKNQSLTGAFWGTGTGPMESISKFYHQIINEGFTKGNPAIFPNTTMVSAIGYASIEARIQGPVALFSDQDLSSSHSLHAARLYLIESAEPSFAICGGAEEYSQDLEKGYLDIGQLSTKKDNTKGFIFSEGAFGLLLENQSPQREGVKLFAHYLFGKQICGELPDKHGYSSNIDGYIGDIIKLLETYGMPDIIITNHKGLNEHDAILDKLIANAFAGATIVKPYKSFGYYLGTSTIFNIIYAICLFEESKSNPAKLAYILTLAPGGLLNIDIISKVENL